MPDQRPTQRVTKNTDPLTNAFRADVYFYLRQNEAGEIELVFDFTQGDNAADHFTAVANAMNARFGPPAARSEQNFTLVYSGKKTHAIQQWLRQGYSLKDTTPEADRVQLEELLEEERAKKSLLPEPSKKVTKSKREKTITEKPATTIPLDSFIKSLGLVPPVDEHDSNSPDALLETIMAFRKAVATLSPPPKPGSEIDENTYRQKLYADLVESVTTTRSDDARFIMQNILNEANIVGTVSVSKMTRDIGFNLTLAKPQAYSNNAWQKKAKALGELLRMLLPREEQQLDIQVSSGGNLMVVKGLDPKGALYRHMSQHAANQDISIAS